jgi:adenylate cyclase
MSSDNPYRDVWYTIFAVGHPALKKFQNFHRRLPSPPRCRLCFAPFRGPGGVLMALMKKSPNSRNPNFCNACDAFMRAYPGGAEVEMSMLFVDARDSTTLAERIGPTEFSKTMSSFHRAAITAINESDGFILGLVGDEVVAVFPPGFCGKDHAGKAIRAAKDLLRLKLAVAADGSMLHIGVGVHSGVAYIGTAIGSPSGAQDVNALGDSVNTAARLSTAAGASEALISEATCKAAGVAVDNLESRSLDLKGKTSPVEIRVWHVGAG